MVARAVVPVRSPRGEDVATLLLTWNPDRWRMDFDRFVARTQAGEPVEGGWSVGNRRHGIGPGDRAFLNRQGSSGRGLVALGEVVSEPYDDEHWSGEGGSSRYVQVRWSEFRRLEDALLLDELESVAPEFAWRKVYASGRTLPESVANRLVQLWAD
jgi:5-methylcytosine-specific restriction protein B